MKFSFNPFYIFKPSPVAKKVLDDLDKYPLNDWDWSTAYHYYKHPKFSYQIYLNYTCLYAVCGLDLGYFDTQRIDRKCQKQMKAALKLAQDIRQSGVIAEILKS